MCSGVWLVNLLLPSHACVVNFVAVIARNSVTVLPHVLS